eukprot:2420593-Pyramimonas_sp.AAC.1
MAAERGMREQPAAFMLQGGEVRATGAETDALPEPTNTTWRADWAVERELATVEVEGAYAGNWDPLTKPGEEPVRRPPVEAQKADGRGNLCHVDPSLHPACVFSR